MSQLRMIRGKTVLLSRKELGGAPIMTMEVLKQEKLRLVILTKPETPNGVRVHRLEINTIVTVEHVE